MYLTAGFAQLAVEGRCAPLLSTKYEPDVAETDRDIEVGKSGFFRLFAKSAMLVTSMLVVQVSYPLPVFGFRQGTTYIARRVAAIFGKRLRPVEQMLESLKKIDKNVLFVISIAVKSSTFFKV